jgi:hypothetical protein
VERDSSPQATTKRTTVATTVVLVWKDWQYVDDKESATITHGGGLHICILIVAITIVVMCTFQIANLLHYNSKTINIRIRFRSDE